MVGVLLKTAMFDPRAFPDPDSFSTDPAKRDPANYLIFGAGQHVCRGADIGTIVLREMVRPLIALKDLRGAAGPAASGRDALVRWTKLAVRFNPALN